MGHPRVFSDVFYNSNFIQDITNGKAETKEHKVAAETNKEFAEVSLDDLEVSSSVFYFRILPSSVSK